MHLHSKSHDQNIAYDSAFLIAILVNGVFVIVQIIFSYSAQSSSLLADAFHNLGDVLGLVLAWIGTHLMKRKPTKKQTYGLKKASILAALINGLLLVFTCGIITTEAIRKLLFPPDIQPLIVMGVAGIGILVNSSTALLFLRGSKDLTIRGAYLHLIYDALISAGVVLSAGLLYWTGWLWIDPMVGLLIALVIFMGTWSLFAECFRLIIDGVPHGISWSAVSDFLWAIPGVEGVHDLHIWAISTQENALSAHLYMPYSELSDAGRLQLVSQLKEQFDIQHTTIQIEKIPIECHDACVNVHSG